MGAREQSMRGARARATAPALLLLVVVVAAARADEPLEDEVESAPFAIVVEHEDGWRCGGALVSLRVALSTASCARGRAPAPPADLWARAPGAYASVGARRVARIAVPIELGAVEGAKWREGAWLGAALDMAVLELEMPFGAAAHVRPILMAAGDECAAARYCLAVRTPAHAAAPLRVGNASLAPPTICAAAAPHWLAVAGRVTCLTGPQFCPSDWGVGIVCAGKLCGVLSRSARGAEEAIGAGAAATTAGGAGAVAAGGAEAVEAVGAGEVASLPVAAAPAPPGCGTTHAAQDVPRWRAFVHCAQTRRYCGRMFRNRRRSDSCASVCSERMLLEQPEGEGGGGGGGGGGTREPARPHSAPKDEEEEQANARVIPHSTPLAQNEMKTESESSGRRTGDAPTRTPPAPAPAKDMPPTGRMAHFEFEPYRADFKTGEYDDNGANYEEREEAPTRTPSASTPVTGSSRVPEALVGPSPSEPPPHARAPASAARAPNAERRALAVDSVGAESASPVHRNTLALYFCIVLIGINNR